MDVFDRAFAKGVMGRVSGPTLAFAPPFVCSTKDIDRYSQSSATYYHCYYILLTVYEH